MDLKLNKTKQTNKKIKDPKYYFSQKPFVQYVNRQSGVCFTLIIQQIFRGCARQFSYIFLFNYHSYLLRKIHRGNGS